MEELLLRTTTRFELSVLEAALSTMTAKFRRQLNLLSPVLELLLQDTSANPDAAMLRRLLAFRKTLTAFEKSVASARRAVTDVLASDADLKGLCLTPSSESSS